jgi:hypothetical protein
MYDMYEYVGQVKCILVLFHNCILFLVRHRQYVTASCSVGAKLQRWSSGAVSQTDAVITCIRDSVTTNEGHNVLCHNRRGSSETMLQAKKSGTVSLSQPTVSLSQAGQCHNQSGSSGTMSQPRHLSRTVVSQPKWFIRDNVGDSVAVVSQPKWFIRDNVGDSVAVVSQPKWFIRDNVRNKVILSGTVSEPQSMAVSHPKNCPLTSSIFHNNFN